MSVGHTEETSVRMPFEMLRWIFGRDVFVSYARADGIGYAAALAQQIAAAGFTVAIDQWGSQSGHSPPRALQRAARWASCLVVVGTPEAIRSRWVREEVQSFPHHRRTVVPIDFGGNLENSALGAMVRGATIQQETFDALDSGQPSQACVARILNSLKFTRQQTRVTWGLAVVATGAAAAVGVALWAGHSATSALALAAQAQAAERRADRAASDAEARAVHMRGQAASAAAQAASAQAQAASAVAASNAARLAEAEAEAGRRRASASDLGLQALATVDHRPEHAAHLALQATALGMQVEVQSAWHAVVAMARPQHRLAHDQKLVAVAYDGSGLRVATASASRRLTVWDTRTGERVAQLRSIETPSGDQITGLRFSHGGTRLIVDSQLAGLPRTDVLDSTTGRVLATKQANLIWLGAALPGDQLAYLDKGRVCWIDMLDGKDLPCGPDLGLAPYDTVALSNDGKHLLELVVEGPRGKVRLWRLDSGQRLPDLEPRHSETEGKLRQLGFAVPHLFRLRLVWDPERHNNHCAGKKSTRVILGGPEQLKVAGLCAQDHRLRRWHAYQHYSEVHDRLYIDGEAYLHDAAFSPDGVQVATVGDDGVLRLWPAEPLEVIWQCAYGARANGFMQDYQVAGAVRKEVVSPRTHDAAWLGELRAMKCGSLLGSDRWISIGPGPGSSVIGTGYGPERTVSGAVWTPGKNGQSMDERSVLFASIDAQGNHVAFLVQKSASDAREDGHFIEVWATKGRKLLSRWKTGDYVQRLNFDASGQVLHVVSGGLSELWQLDGQRLPAKGETSHLGSADLHPQRARLLNVQGTTSLVESAFDGTAGNPPLHLGAGIVLAHYDSNGDQALVVTKDRRLHLLDTRRGLQVRRSFDLLNADASDARFSPDGTIVATVSLGGVVDVFDARNGRRLATYKNTDLGPNTKIAFSPEGRYLLISGGASLSVLACSFCGPIHEVAALGSAYARQRTPVPMSTRAKASSSTQSTRP
jgi:WD40 repeat protein